MIEVVSIWNAEGHFLYYVNNSFITLKNELTYIIKNTPNI